MVYPSAMKINLWPIDKPQPFPDNPRTFGDSDIEAVANSIKRFGWRQPIVVDGDGVIVMGHLRLAAAKHLELTEVPVHVAEDLDEKQIHLLRIADNKLGELAAWEPNKLRSLVSIEDSVPLVDLGFSLAHLDSLTLSEEEYTARAWEQSNDESIPSDLDDELDNVRGGPPAQTSPTIKLIIRTREARDALQKFVESRGGVWTNKAYPKKVVLP